MKRDRDSKIAICVLSACSERSWSVEARLNNHGWSARGTGCVYEVTRLERSVVSGILQFFRASSSPDHVVCFETENYPSIPVFLRRCGICFVKKKKKPEQITSCSELRTAPRNITSCSEAARKRVTVKSLVRFCLGRRCMS